MARPRTKPAPDLTESVQRLQTVIHETGLSRAKFAASIGMTASGIGHLFLREGEVSKSLARAIELEHGISHHWLLTGEGEMSVQKKTNKLEQLRLRISPDFNPELCWMVFEALLREGMIGRLRLGKDYSPDQFRGFAEGIFRHNNSKEWLDDLFIRQLSYDSQLQEAKKVFLSFAWDVAFGSFDQEVLLQIMLDGIKVTDEMLAKLTPSARFRTPEVYAEYVTGFKRFAELRQSLTSFFAPPRELIEEFVRLENEYMDTQEKQEIEKLRKKERYTPLAGWRRIDENGEVLDDPERREIYKYKIMIAEYEERKQNPEFSSLEMQIEINQKIKSLQVDLEKLIDSWQKGGGDGTTG